MKLQQSNRRQICSEIQREVDHLELELNRFDFLALEILKTILKVVSLEKEKAVFEEVNI